MKKGAEKKAYAVINWIKKHLLVILIVIFSCVIVLDVANYSFNPMAGNASAMGMPSGSLGDTSDFSGQTMPGNADDSNSQTTDGSSSGSTGENDNSGGTVSSENSASTEDASTDGNAADTDSASSADTATDSSAADGADTGSKPSGDMSNGEMPSGEMPSGEMPSGEMPSGMTPPGTESADSNQTDMDSTDGTASDTIASLPQTENADNSMNNLFFNALILLRRAWLPVLIVFSAADALVIILFVRKKRKEMRARKAAEEKARKEALLADVVWEEEDGQPEKRRRGFWVAPCCLVVAIAVVVAMLPTGGSGSSMIVNEEVVESTAEKNTISTVLSGTGTLTDSDAVEVTVPDSVDVTSYLVDNGDTVSVGDALATVDTTSVEAAIVELQDVIDELDADLVEEGEKSAESTVTATTAGKVKYIYAASGTSVADTVSENGALALLSLDGLMAVDIETSAVSVGDSVTVTLSDGSTEKGTVASISEGKATVTLSDDAAYQDAVSVSASDGTELGSGSLYINSELKVLAYNGTVESINVSVDDEVDEGDTLMTLTDVGHTATYQAMVTRRSELEAQMEELFKLTQDGTVYAQTAGIVSGVSDDLLATNSDGSGISCVRLANETPDSAESSLVNYAATVSAVSGDKVTLKVSSLVYSHVDYTDLSEMSFSNLKNSLELTYTDKIWKYQDGWSKSVSVSDLQVGDKLVLTCPTGSTDSDDIIWIVYVGNADGNQNSQSGSSGNNGSAGEIGQESDSNENTGETGQGTESNGSTGKMEQNTDNNGSTDESELIGGSGQSTGENDGSGQDDALTNGQSANVLQGNITDETLGENNFSDQTSGTEELSSELTGSDTSSATTEETAVYDQYSISEKNVCAVTPQEQMTITMSVDELDIMSLENGQEAQITLDAISGQSFTGSVTQIELVGENDGGNTKYSVKVTLDRTEDMLAGMNASVKITTATSDSVTTVPVEALVEQDGNTYVYTSYDKSSDTLGSLTEVETGVSDGDIVEIVSGLEEGDSCFYKYAETVTYNFLAGSR